MSTNEDNNIHIETVQLTEEEIRSLEVIQEESGEWLDDEDIIIDNAAVFTIDYDAQQLVIFYGGTRNVVMELDNDFEVALCDRVLGDPNFWLEFIKSLSAAIKRST